ncbi:RNA-splicing ligase RtcB [Dermacoccus sp. GAS27A]
MLRHSGIRELEWAQHFALLNREEMMDRVVRQYSEWAGEPVIEQERINCHHNYTERLPVSLPRKLGSELGATPGNRERLPVSLPRKLGSELGATPGNTERLPAPSARALCNDIGAGRRYSELAKGRDADVWLSRKGAINAEAGRPGLIPGSMGTASYVVVGKGNALSLHSSPHGAGRQFPRSAARKRFTGDQLREAMAGIEYRDTDAFVDEIPQAYKDIDQVMADAADLVEVRHVLRQIVNVKGD